MVEKVEGKAKRGGKRPGSGRKKGIPNKGTAEIKEFARQWGPAAVEKMAALAGLVKDRHGEPVGQSLSEQTQAYCCDRILDRAYGKPALPIGSDPENPLQLLMSSLDGLTRGLPGSVRPSQ